MLFPVSRDFLRGCDVPVDDDFHQAFSTLHETCIAWCVQIHRVTDRSIS